MIVCVYGAASPEISGYYIEAVESLGEKLAKRGHHLIYGAGAEGLMGAAARGFHSGGGRVCGVAPSFFREADIEELYERADQIIVTESMGTRKEIMEMNGDAFVVAPGGIGTIDELFQVLTLKQLHRINKPIALFNIRGFYDPVNQLMHMGAEAKFLRKDCLDLYRSFNEFETDQLIEYIETKPAGFEKGVEQSYS